MLVSRLVDNDDDDSFVRPGVIVGLGYLTKNSFFLLPLRLENQSKFHYFPVAKTTSPPTFPSFDLCTDWL